MLNVTGGRVLNRQGWENANVFIRNGLICDSEGASESRGELDASGLLVLPGIIDIHGDAFERQIMPRPGVAFDLELAMRETDRQLASNGITTAYHGVTCSWEPGLRSISKARSIVHKINAMRGTTATDMRVHLRHETFNVDAASEIAEWIADGLVQALAFNDHMRGIVLGKPIRASKLRTMVERSGVAEDDFLKVIEQTLSREGDIPAALQCLSARATKHGVPLLSHDDRDPTDREYYRDLGCFIAEFPIQEDVAENAVANGEHTVFGAPNVVRGGSHTGWLTAADMAEKGLCTILSSDYYYPALLEAPFKLAREERMSLAEAWRLVSTHPAQALELSDRGLIAEGCRADLLLVDASSEHPRLIATLVRGEPVWLSEPRRLKA